MSDQDEWVRLIECNDVVELHTVRATLEARGVPCRVRGEHTHGIMGAMQGAVVRSRVEVPRRAMAVARELVEDIVGPFDEAPPTDDEPPQPSPFRVAGELVPVQPGTPMRSRTEADLRPKSYGVVMLLALTVVGPLLGLSHVAAGRNLRAGILALVSICALPAFYAQAPWASLVLGGVWIFDLVGGAQGVAAHNRRVKAVAAAREDEEDDEDDDDEDEDDDDHAPTG